MAFTFTTLKTAIQDYTENTETTFTNNLTRFILNSEERILKECQLESFRRNSTGTTTEDIIEPVETASNLLCIFLDKLPNSISPIFSVAATVLKPSGAKNTRLEPNS